MIVESHSAVDHQINQVNVTESVQLKSTLRWFTGLCYFNEGTGSKAAGYWGDYNCDPPYHTLENMMEAIVAQKDQVRTYCPFCHM